VEGLDQKSAQAVRLSFSTKLVDYFKCAKPIVAIGPMAAASINYLANKQCALVVQTEEEIYTQLLNCLNNSKQLSTLALKAYICGKENHDKKYMQKMLIDDLTKIPD
jgi:hypothetical protein